MTDRTPPKVSVIIPVLNAGPALLDLIDSLVPEQPGIEVIAVDNGSRDGATEENARRHPSIRVLRNEANVGYARAANQGAAVAAASYLLFLNTDAICARRQADQLVEVAASDDLGAVWQPLILDTRGRLDSAGDAFTWWGFLWHERTIESQPRSVFAAKGPALLIRREVFEGLGGFRDSYFAYFEESDFCWRARLAGWEIRLVPSVTVTHVGGVTTRRILVPHEIRYLSFRNRLRSILANCSGLTLARVLPRHVIGCVLTAVAFAMRGRLRSSWAVLSPLAWPLANLDEVRRERRASQGARVVPDAQVLRANLTVRLSPRRAIHLLAGQLTRWEQPPGGADSIAKGD